MRLITRAAIAFAATAGLLGAAVAPAAQAAPAPAVAHVAIAKKAAPALSIKTIGTKTVSGKAKATVKPSYTAKAGTKVSSARITVKKGSKTVAASKPSVKLGVGSYKVTTVVKFKAKGAKKVSTLTKTQTLKVVKKSTKPAVKRGPVPPRPGSWACPASHPIKGNASSMIYHVRGGAFYERTNPEACFATASDARAAGYRASKR